jgi:dipeptidyl aminopeptidase/acylaminoacyl peptidase
VVVDRLQYKADGEGLIGDRRAHVFVLDALSGESTQLTAGDFTVSGVRWSPDGEALAYAATVGEDRDLAATSTVFVVPAGGGEAVALTPPTSLLSAPTWFPDGQQLLVCGQERFRSGHNGLFVVPRAGGVPKAVAQLDRNVMLGSAGYPGAQPVVLPDGNVLLMVRDRGCTHLYGGAPDAPPRCLVGGPGRSLSALSVAGGLIAYLVSDGATNGELCVAALDGTEERRLTHHLTEAVPGVTLPAAQPREFVAPDGTTVHGWVLRAAETAGASPLLLDIHGGPHNAWGPTFDGVHLYHQELVARGWTVLLVNPRGSDGYGERFYAGITGNWGLIDEGDFLTPVDDLVDEGLVDGSKVVVTGYSYGGYMSCWLSARHPDRWAAAIPGGVVTDLSSTAGTADVGNLLGPLEFGGFPWDVPEMLRASSPMSYVRQVTAPTLLLQGERDDRCPVSQAEMWFAALRTRQVPVTLVRYPEGSHLFVLDGRPSHRQDWCTRIVDFAVQHTS